MEKTTRNAPPASPDGATRLEILIVGSGLAIAVTAVGWLLVRLMGEN